MCELCCAATEDWEDRPLPGFFLCRATKDGHWMKAGEWGLGIVNDPEFSWAATPMKDPSYGMTDEEMDVPWTPEFEAEWDEFYDRLEVFRKEMSMAPFIGFKLVQAAITLGFNPETSGRFELWLFHYLATWLETHTKRQVDIIVTEETH